MGGLEGESYVYLAGAIEFAPDGGKQWRREMAAFVERELGIKAFDPCVNELNLLSAEEKACFRQWKVGNRSRFLPAIRRIIDYDLDRLLNHTAFIICLWDEYVTKGAGTAGELTLAYHHGIPVYLMLDMPAVQASSWILGCATEVFTSFDALKQYLLDTQVRPEVDMASRRSE